MGQARRLGIGKISQQGLVFLGRARLVAQTAQAHPGLEQGVGIFVMARVGGVDGLELRQRILILALGVEAFAYPVLGIGRVTALGILLQKLPETGDPLR